MGITISSNKRSFLKNGKHFFYLADTCWSAFTNISDESWEYYLQYRKKQGYNTIQINILPQWDASETSLNYAPFAKDEEGHNIYSQINDDYFHHAKRMCIKAKEFGFELALVVLWCNYVPDTWANKLMKSKTMPYENIEIYINKVHETFTSLEPIYVISGDTDLENETTRKHYKKAGKLLKKLAPDCLQTYHIKGRMKELPQVVIDNIDFYMYQTGHSANLEDESMTYEMPKYFIENYPIKPLINSEPCYENIGFAGNRYGRFNQKDIRIAAWHSMLSGASAGITYGSGGVYSWHEYGKHFAPCIGEGFDMPHPWQLALHYPGAWDYGDIKNILLEYGVTYLCPKQELLLNDTEKIRIASTIDEKLFFIYAPYNTTIKLDLNINDIAEVIIVDLKSRHKEVGNTYQIEDVCCLEMHMFNQDVIYIVKLDK